MPGMSLSPEVLRRLLRIVLQCLVAYLLGSLGPRKEPVFSLVENKNVLICVGS